MTWTILNLRTVIYYETVGLQDSNFHDFIFFLLPKLIGSPCHSEEYVFILCGHGAVNPSAAFSNSGKSVDQTHAGNQRVQRLLPNLRVGQGSSSSTQVELLSYYPCSFLTRTVLAICQKQTQNIKQRSDGFCSTCGGFLCNTRNNLYK